jgi:hypothetical protein
MQGQCCRIKVLDPERLACPAWLSSENFDEEGTQRGRLGERVQLYRGA